MTDADRNALERCLTILREDPEGARQIAAQENWLAAALFACHCVQARALRLYPWRKVPADCDEHDRLERDLAGQALLRKMLAANLSRYEPDPLAALKAVEG